MLICAYVQGKQKNNIYFYLDVKL